MYVSIGHQNDLEILTLYSTFFRESRVPRHIRLVHHITSWAIEEWLYELLRSRGAQPIEPPYTNA